MHLSVSKRKRVDDGVTHQTWIHPTMDPGHPTTEVVNFIFEILSEYGALKRSNFQERALFPRLPMHCVQITF